MNRLQTYHQKLKKEDFTEVKSSFLVCDSVGVRTQDPQLRRLLTSSSCHPKIFVKEFSYFLMPCHQHCLGVNLLVQR